MSDLAPPPIPAPLIEGIDYYLNELGLLTFTESYLRKRGHCCENGCKHCPYGLNLLPDGES